VYHVLGFRASFFFWVSMMVSVLCNMF
jgi:hypothetical protein